MNVPASTGSHPRRNRSFPDPMTSYHEHHLGQTRTELRAETRACTPACTATGCSG